VEDGLGLTSVTALLTIITTLSLGEQRSLSSLVLCWDSVGVWDSGFVGLLTGDLVLGVLLAVLALAVGSSGLGNVDLRCIVSKHSTTITCCSLGASRVFIR
jgi:hypothetical protein